MAVLEGRMGYYRAAETYSVPQSTLERKVKLARENNNTFQEVKVSLGPKSPIFSATEEAELVQYLQDMESRLFGLTTDDLKSLAYEFSNEKQERSPFQHKNKGKAGKDWLLSFFKPSPGTSH